jgi:hypothetical protein
VIGGIVAVSTKKEVCDTITSNHFDYSVD